MLKGILRRKLLAQSQQISSRKSQIESILDFVGHLVHAATSQLCHCGEEATVDNT